MNYEPMNDNVLLKPTGTRINELREAKVVAVGPGMPTIVGRMKPRIKKGDVVLVDESRCRTIFKDGDRGYLLLLTRENKICLKVKENRKIKK